METHTHIHTHTHTYTYTHTHTHTHAYTQPGAGVSHPGSPTRPESTRRRGQTRPGTRRERPTTGGTAAVSVVRSGAGSHSYCYYCSPPPLSHISLRASDAMLPLCSVNALEICSAAQVNPRRRRPKRGSVPVHAFTVSGADAVRGTPGGARGWRQLQEELHG